MLCMTGHSSSLEIMKDEKEPHRSYVTDTHLHDFAQYHFSFYKCAQLEPFAHIRIYYFIPCEYIR